MPDLPLLWAEVPDDEEDESADAEPEAQVDDSFAARRLRRWLRGMFGGTPRPADGEEPADREPGT